MTSIPANLARVPTNLASQISLGAIQRSGRGVLEMQLQLASGLRVNRPSDDAVASGTIAVLDDVIEQREQRLRNQSHAESVLNNLDAALADATELLIEAKGIGSSQIGIGSDSATRANQANVIDSMLDELVTISNRQYQGIHFFGGSATANEPIGDLNGGLRYRGSGEGLSTDLGQARSFPITVSADEAFGALSTRVEGERDLDPAMQGATRLVDLDGARGRGVALGSITVDVAGTALTVDLTSAHTVQDVIDTLQTAIQTVDAGATVGIAPAGNALEITPALGPITISDPGADATAADLGIAATFPLTGAAGADLDPRLTELTPIASLAGVSTPLGTIRITNGNAVRDVDLSGVTNVRELMIAVESLQIGARVRIAGTGDRLDFVNELSGSALSVSEVGGGSTATELGVRSLTGSTLLADFNDGRGVQIVSGNVDPISGLPDPARDLDLRVTLKDGRTFDADLAGALTVQDVLDRLNAAAGAAGVGVPAEFNARLAADGNGISLVDSTPPAGGTTSVTALNGSFAAQDLGILGTSTGASLDGEDRATVAVQSVFTHMIALRDAMTADDERGITLATEALEADIARLVETRAAVGVRSQRVADAALREEDLRIQDMSLRSELKDLDFTEAAIRFSTLQQQLQAGLLSASRLDLTLLDFLR